MIDDGRRRLLLGFASLFLLGPSACAPPPKRPASNRRLDGPSAFDMLESEFHAAINGARAREGMIALIRDAQIDNVARGHSRDMAHRRYLSHVNPEGENPVARLQRAGRKNFTLVGENVGLTSRPQPIREIVHGWLASPVHRENLLGSAFNTTGIGIASALDGALYFTQLYLTRPR